MVLDAFTKTRLLKILEDYAKTHGHDISARELKSAGITEETIQQAIRDGFVKKHQVSTAKGSVENRYKVLKDWKLINS